MSTTIQSVKRVVRILALVLNVLTTMAGMAALGLFIAVSTTGGTMSVIGGYIASLLCIAVNCYALLVWRAKRKADAKTIKAPGWASLSPEWLGTLHAITTTIIIALSISSLTNRPCPSPADIGVYSRVVTNKSLLRQNNICESSVTVAGVLLTSLAAVQLTFSVAYCCQICAVRRKRTKEQCVPEGNGVELPTQERSAMRGRLELANDVTRSELHADSLPTAELHSTPLSSRPSFRKASSDEESSYTVSPETPVKHLQPEVVELP